MSVKDFLSSHFVRVDVEDTVSSLLGKLRVLDELSAVVFNGDKAVGMADKRKFLRTRIDAKSTKVKRVVTKVPMLSLDTTEEEAARLMSTSNMHTLPVVQGSEVVGVIYARDLLRILKPKLQDMRIKDLSTEKLEVMDENEPVSKAINSFRTMHFDHAPIVDKKGSLIGMVTITDLLEKYFASPPRRNSGMGIRGPASNPAKEFNFAHLPISNEMSLLVHSLPADAPLSKAVDVMISEHMSSLLLVDGKKPTGIITVKDILSFVTGEHTGPAKPKVSKKR